MLTEPEQKHQSFRVYVRCRPFNDKESTPAARKRAVTLVDPCIVNLVDLDGRQTSLNYDEVFGESHSNEEVFKRTVQPLIRHFINGYNSTAFAYGITGAGKSFTMFGNYYKQNNKPGLIPLAISHILSIAPKDTTFKISYLEIYNEQIFDLLVDNSHNLQIIQDPEKGVQVLELAEKPLTDIHSANQYIKEGNFRRVMAQTNANDFSSRSHAVVLISMERRIDNNKLVTAKFSLVDLAGSERASVYDNNNKGIRSLEGSSINKSLLALGNCINSLSENKKGGFVPYRDSKLTRLLKDSLGGNTKTVMIACISPSVLCFEETINTLKYAGRAKKIEKVVHQNMKELTSNAALKDELQRLKKQNHTLKNIIKKSNKQPLMDAVASKERVNKLVAQLVEVLTDGIRMQENLRNTSFADQKEDFQRMLVQIQNEKDNLIERIANPMLEDKSSHDDISEAPEFMKISTKQSPNKRPKSVLREDRSNAMIGGSIPTANIVNDIKSKFQRCNSQLHRPAVDPHPVTDKQNTAQMSVYEKELQNLVQQGRSNPRVGMSLPKHQIPVLANPSMHRSKHMQSLRELQKITERLAQMNRSNQLRPATAADIRTEMPYEEEYRYKLSNYLGEQ